MSRRFIDKAFSHAQFCENKRNPSRQPRRKKKDQSTREVLSTVDKIIAAADKQDFLKVLGLPLPDVDALGDPVWPYDDSHIRKYYRSMCLRVHPDKNDGDKARHAFQLVTHAYKTMLNADKRSEILKSSCEAARAAKEEREAKATVDQRIKINAEKIEQKRKLNKLQHDKFHSEIVRQMQERKQQISTKRRKTSPPLSSSQTEEQIEDTSDAPPSAKKPEDISETAVRTDLVAIEKPDIHETEKQRIRRKLKEGKIQIEVQDEVEGEEWEGALIHRSRQQRRKPRFLF